MGFHKARDAAWREFGRRWWRVIVAIDLTRRSAPAIAAGTIVAALAGAVWWVAVNASMPSLPDVDLPDVGWPPVWVWPAATAALIVTAVIVRRIRRPYRSYRPGAGRGRVINGTIVVGLALVAWLLRDAG